MAQNDLRQAIADPAAERVMYFEPHSLVDQLINEVVQMPGALPLLSFTLSELYLKYLQRHDGNRALTQADYEALGGVAGSLTQRATQEYDALVQTDSAYAHTVKQVMLRMVAVAGGELARRRVPRSELVYASEAENARVAEVIRRLTEARLIVEGQEPGGEPYVEPAHDALVQGWHQLQRWKNEEQESLALQRLLTTAAREWDSHRQTGKANGLLWNENPRLNLLKETLASEQCWLNRLERLFVEQSFKHRRRRRFRLGTIAAGVFLVLSGLTTFAFVLWGIAEQRAKDAEDQTAIAQEQEILANQRLEESQEAQKREEEERQRAENEATINELGAQADRAAKLIETTYAASGLILAVDLAVRSQNIPSLRTTVQSVLFSAVQATRELNRLQAVQPSSYERSQTVVNLESQRIGIKTGDGSIHIWDAQSGQALHEASQSTSNLEFDFDKNQATNFDSNTELWHGTKAFSGDSSLIATIGSSGKNIKILNSNTGETIRESGEGHGSEIVALAISPDGSRIASASGARHWRELGETEDSYQAKVQSENYSIRIWDASTLEPISESLGEHSNYITSLEFSPDSERLVTGSTDGTIRIWDVSSRQSVNRLLQNRLGNIASVIFSSNNRVVSNTENGLVQIWDTSEYNGELLSSASSSPVRSVMFSPDGTRIASLIEGYQGQDTLRLWNPESGALINTLPISSAWNNDVFFSPDKKYIIEVSLDGGTRLWDAYSGQPIGNVPEKYKSITPFGDSSVNGKFLIKFEGKSVEIFNTASNRVTQKASMPSYHYAMASSHLGPNGKYFALIAGHVDAGVAIWHIQENQATKKLHIMGESSSLAFSPNGKRTVIAMDDGSMRVWNTTTGQPIRAPLEGHQNVVSALAYSPDGRLIASGDRNGMIRLWNAKTGQSVGEPLYGHEGRGVGALSFSPNDD